MTKGLTEMLGFNESVRGAGWLSREGLRAQGQKHSTAGIPAQVEPCRGAASLAPAGKNVRHVKMLHLSYYSINTPVTESHFQRPPLLLALPGLLWKIFTEIWGNPWFWQRYGRVELYCWLSAFCKRVNSNILGRLPCSHSALTCSKQCRHYVILWSPFTKQDNKGDDKEGKDIPLMEILCSRNEDWEKNHLKKRGGEEMPGDIPMYRKEEKNLQAQMLETKRAYYQVA